MSFLVEDSNVCHSRRKYSIQPTYHKVGLPTVFSFALFAYVQIFFNAQLYLLGLLCNYTC